MDREWVRYALSKATILRGLKFSFLVGPIYIIINHGDALLRLDVDSTRLLKMFMTMVVPFCVSVFSSIQTVRFLLKKQRQESERAEER